MSELSHPELQPGLAKLLSVAAADTPESLLSVMEQSALDELKKHGISVPLSDMTRFGPPPLTYRTGDWGSPNIPLLNSLWATVWFVRKTRECMDLGDTRNAVWNALGIARAVSVYNVKWLGHDAVVGRKVLGGQRRGHKQAHGTPDERATRYAEWQRALIEHAGACPDLKRRAVQSAIAKRFRVSLRTIQMHTTFPTE